jgi:transcriptional regulator with XRE-family HTH domain
METTISFGYWIRRQRKALDLTQQALADRVGCSLAANFLPDVLAFDATPDGIEQGEDDIYRWKRERWILVGFEVGRKHRLYLRYECDTA